MLDGGSKSKRNAKMRRERKKSEEKKLEKRGPCSWRRRKSTTGRPKKVRRCNPKYLPVVNANHAVDAKKTDAEKAEEADAEILAAIASRRKLASDLELAKGVQYTEPLKTRWVSSPPQCCIS